VITIKEHRSFEKILIAIRELEAWEKRNKKLRSELKRLNTEGKEELDPKLEKVNQQMHYYESLTRDMKREVKPSNLSDLMRALVRY
jgi:hypothetical protein